MLLGHIAARRLHNQLGQMQTISLYTFSKQCKQVNTQHLPGGFRLQTALYNYVSTFHPKIDQED